MIIIHKNGNGDTRTAEGEISFAEFQAANDSHREDVRQVMAYLADLVRQAGENHDYTKKTEEALQYQNFLEARQGKTPFGESRWYRMHVQTERHHLKNGCPVDVDLVDVLEMLADCLCAGLARSGKAEPVEIPAEILLDAVRNTQEKILQQLQLDK